MITQAASILTAQSEKIRQEIALTLAQGYSFALWRKPLEETVHLLVSESARTIEAFSIEDCEPGFLFSPFRSSVKKIFLPADRYFLFGSDTNQVTNEKYQPDAARTAYAPNQFYRSTTDDRSTSSKESTPSDYELLISDCIHHIRAGKFEKVVPTRRKEINLPDGFDLIDLFDKLCQNYPNAMVSLTSTPFSGTWIGATPEPLVSIDRNRIFRTVALAGTQPYDPSTPISHVSWRQKEIEEQALVERYIINCLKKIRLREFSEVGPRTVQAGNLLHLRSDFTVDLNEVRFPDLGTVMLNLMHPTSAICGMPMEPAQEYLIKHEGYEREFYSGYLGPVNVENETHLFVNLRCMKWSGQTAWLYAGAGITADSDPASEVKESEMKMETLHRLIRQS